jgi:glutamate dehydrogenase
MFSVPADLFIPAGGRPETIDSSNWQKMFAEDGTLLTRAIVEGANSFITPTARDEIQKRGVVVIRDASANKCGVISSSYEIIANLLLSDEEFLAHKEEYVTSVIEILKQRAEDEARLIFKRHRQSEGKLFTEISAEISTEINDAYARLFEYFSSQPQLFERDHYRLAILQHLPSLLRENRQFSARIDNLPEKIRAAILASEVASTMTYCCDEESDFAETVELRLKRIAAA